MSTYDELLGTVARMADAAIEWDMELLDWHKTANGWVSGFNVSPTTTYELDATGMYVYDRNNDETFHANEFALTSQIDFRGLWRSWYERMNDAFRPFLGMPEPGDFTPQITALQEAAGALNVATVATGTGARTDDEIETGNGHLDAALTSLVGEIVAMNGAAMDLFAINYSNRLPGVVRGQLAMVGLLGSCLSGEKNLWEKAQIDVAGIADDVMSVLEAKDSGGSSRGLQILGAVLAGASLFFTAGTSAAVIGASRTVLGILQTVAPAEQAPPPAADTFGGSSPGEVFGKLTAFLAEFDQALYAEEEVVQRSLDNGLAEVRSHAGDFDLATLPALVSLDDDAVLAAGDIDVKPETLVFLGTAVIPVIAGEIRGARNGVSRSGGFDAWSRSGSVGMAPYGGDGQFDDLRDEFVLLAGGTARALDDVAQKLIDVAAQFVDVDAIQQQNYDAFQQLLQPQTV
ncbi:MAG: hypothetical protein CMJ44_17600 [Pimelobacter sp.]|nr:hypothetical protein [Pimelobacter sp.]